MPYPNEHACRIKEPGDFEPGSFRRIKQGKVSIIIGRLRGKSTTTTQAIRYPKDQWSAAEARAECAKHGGRFDAAVSESELPDHLDPAKNPIIKMED
jgi:hypothetical protein